MMNEDPTACKAQGDSKWDFMNARICPMTARVAGPSSTVSKECGAVA